MESKCAQISIFVIIALIIVGGIAGFFLLKDKLFAVSVPAEFKEVYDYYTSCLNSYATDGAKILGTQAGYMKLPDFSPGSNYAPFSNQLDFFGFGVPYWYYITGNGLAKEQVPTKKEMQDGLATYIKEKAPLCDFTEFRRNGYTVELEGEASASTAINDNKISATITQNLVLGKIGETKTTRITTHKIAINSNLGAFYNLAKKIYDYESHSLFIENYSIDALNLYAPVSKTELTCSPIVWNPYDVFKTLKNALSANLGEIRLKGFSQAPSAAEKDYFVVDVGASSNVGARVNVLYNPEWSSRFEVWPTDNNLMMAMPVGPQQGLGVAGFCYVTYKYVYDMFFPVMIQIYSNDGEELFQFPIAVVVNKNFPREAQGTQPLVESTENICGDAKTDLSIITLNSNLEPVEAQIKFKCFTDVCELGKTNISSGGGAAILDAKVPNCVNGILLADAEGYKEAKQIVSTNEESSAALVLNKENKLKLEVYVDKKLSNDLAVLIIDEYAGMSNVSEPFGNVIYPANPEFDLGEGYYKFDLKVYNKNSITIPESKQKKCVNIPKEGVLGFLGFDEEKCFEYTIPSQTVSNMLYAGGKIDWYLTQGEIDGARILRVYATSVPTPSSIDKLQESYDIIDAKTLDIALA